MLIFNKSISGKLSPKRTLILLVLFYLFTPATPLLSQSRNEKVMEMNQIIKMMDEFSFINQQAYFDAVHLHAFFSNTNNFSNPENYLFCTKTSKAKQSGSYTGIEKYFHLIPEVQPDANGLIPFYYSFFYRWLWEKEQVEKRIKAQQISSEILPYLTEYMASADSLFSTHKRLNDYVFDKSFQSDPAHKLAESILKSSHHWFKACLENSLQLDSVLRDYYLKNLPPDNSYPQLQSGLQEIELSMTLLADWRKTLYSEDLSQNNAYDKQLRLLNEEGLKKDSLYLYNTEGYGYLSDGSWSHTRYRTFYTSMESTIYWFSGSKPYTEPFMKQSQSSYNKFILSYNQLVENYNRYSAISDGVTYSNEKVCCPPRYERDTTVNVLLTRPRLLYKFEFHLAEKNSGTNGRETIPAAYHSEALSDEKRITQALPHHLIYLLDVSASMNKFKKLTDLKSNTKYLVSIQREVDKISMITFSDKSELILDAVSCNQKQLIISKIDQIHAQGQTNIFEGLKTVKKLLIKEKKIISGINTVLVITDGEFLITKKTTKIIQELRRNQIGICLINVEKNKGNKDLIQNYLTQLGVKYYDINHENLKEILMMIATK